MTETNWRSWIALTTEEPIDGHRQIIDAHHHLHVTAHNRYLLDDLLADTRASHNVTHTVFCETGASYREHGLDILRPVGETEFVAQQALQSNGSPTRISGIVAFADLRSERLDDILQAHEAAGAGLLRGVRYRLAWDANAEIPSARDTPPHLMTEPTFQRGVQRLGERGYVFDAYVYHPQLTELVELAHKAEGTEIVIDHLGMPLNVGPYTQREAVGAAWRQAMRLLAACPNVTVKLGGIGMDRMFFRTGWSTRSQPPHSEEVACYWGDDLRWCVDTFGPSRCMFESNYPVDRSSLSYSVVWNTFQRIATLYTDEEQDELFSGTAARVYQISRVDSRLGRRR